MQTVKRPKNTKIQKIGNPNFKIPGFEDDPPKNRHDFANSEKIKKIPKSKKKMETQTSKCQVSKGYNPKNRHDFANSEKNFKIPGFERL